MAYQTGTSTGAENLLTTLETFVSANGWTVDDSAGSSSEKLAIHKNGVYVSFRYNSSPTPGTDEIVSIHQATGHTVSADPGNHTGDSGNGYNSSSSVSGTNLDNERYVNLGLSSEAIGNTYYFFEQDASPAYVHVVIVRADGECRHFGFGEIDKFGTWTGGDYAYGHFINNTPEGNFAGNNRANVCGLLDGAFSPTTADRNYSATMTMSSMPDQAAGGAWADIFAAKSHTPNTDTAGNAKAIVQGGFRGGMITRALGGLYVDKNSGFINTIPLHLWYYNTTPATPRLYYLGSMADVRMISMEGFATGEEVTIGSDTWLVFPFIRKSIGSIAGSNYSYMMGVAYRKETA